MMSEAEVRSVGFGRFLDWKVLEASGAIGGVLVVGDEKFKAPG